jgi:hypothetical protein
VFVKIRIALDIFKDRYVLLQLRRDFDKGYTIEKAEKGFGYICGENKVITVDGKDWSFMYNNNSKNFILTYLEKDESNLYMRKPLISIMEESGKRTWTMEELNKLCNLLGIEIKMPVDVKIATEAIKKITREA